MKSARSFIANQDTLDTEYEGYRSLALDPLIPIRQQVSANVLEAKAKEINDLETRIQDFQESAQTSLQKKKEEIYTPIIKKAEDAIKGIAKEKGYSYIFDTSVGVVLFAQESDDIMPMVKTKLGIK